MRGAYLLISARGAASVFAIDVGHGQLADKLRRDPRVVVLERTNARYIERATLGESVELVVVDASFIGVEKLLPGIVNVLEPGGTLVALVKPQFEAGKDEAKRSRGVIRDDGVRSAAIARARDAIVRRIRGAVEDFRPGYEPVTLTAENGQAIKGVKKNEDSYSVQIMDTRERIQGYEKDKVKDVKDETVSAMPTFGVDRLSASDLDDVVRYLQTLKGWDPAVK